LGQIQTTPFLSKVSGEIREIDAVNYELDATFLGRPEYEMKAAVILGTGVHNYWTKVSYVPIGDEVRQVELIITGTIPSEVNLYEKDSSEQQGKFGNICVAYPGTTGGHAPDAFQQWCWTRRTVLDVPAPRRGGRFIRVFTRAALSWVLYDTGLREKTPPE
jgi:hypothetical protein